MDFSSLKEVTTILTLLVTLGRTVFSIIFQSVLGPMILDKYWSFLYILSYYHIIYIFLHTISAAMFLYTEVFCT